MNTTATTAPAQVGNGKTLHQVRTDGFHPNTLCGRTATRVLTTHETAKMRTHCQRCTRTLNELTTPTPTPAQEATPDVPPTAETPKPTTQTPPRRVYRAKGTTDEVTQCELCGKNDLKGTVVLAILDEDSNEDGISYFGSDCAARATGWTQREVKRAARDADRERREAAERVRRTIDRRHMAARAAWILHHHGTTNFHAAADRLNMRTLELIRRFEADYKSLSPTESAEPTPNDTETYRILGDDRGSQLHVYATEQGTVIHPVNPHLSGYNTLGHRLEADRNRKHLARATAALTRTGWTVTDHGPWITATR